MKALKRGLIAIFAAAALVCGALAFLLPAKWANADEVALEGSDDVFELTEKSFAAEEKFVFTSTVTFERGNAAGLVFGADESHKWVFNVDRAANRVKLMYFSEEAPTEVLREEWFIGNGKITEGEQSLVNPKVAALDKVQLKAVITPQGESVFAEFYADNIRRFAFNEKGEDLTIDLNSIKDGISYEGGKTGYNCFSAKVRFNETYIGVSDYSYYTELYRQQYHFSQYAHWNNDPNGLVYYNGYYHLFYQHHPYSNFWSDMYWGHARSKDLAHWELLPVCLFPDTQADGWGQGNGYMWSGSAMVYHKGMSDAIDALNWFNNGEGTGLIAFYTRDGGFQDQILMSSDDGGITWTKRKAIPYSLLGEAKKKSCRDPKVFPVKTEGEKVTLWGMIVTGMETHDVWFLKSTDLFNWEKAGGFSAYRPECPDVVTLEADDNTTHTVITFTGRQYLVGEIGYDEASGNIIFTDFQGNIAVKYDNLDNKTDDDIKEILKAIPFQTMDFGPDSYATQSFYIDDETSAYYGSKIALSWFSGVPGAEASIESGTLAAARKVWNGGGMTIPVEYGLVSGGNGGYILTQTPVVKTSAEFKKLKTSVYSGVNEQITPESENILKDLNTHCFELEASIQNPEQAAVYFRINMNANEYTEIGWNAEDGYYVDRSHAGVAGLNLGNYRRRYSKQNGDGTELNFYILSDNGGVEVYCDEFKVPFYVLTFSSPYATGARLFAEAEVTASVEVNEIASTWRKEAEAGETVLYVSAEELTLDKTLTAEKEVMAYSTDGGEINWTLESGEGVVSVEKTQTGAKIKSLSAGNAVVAVTCGNVTKKVNVKVLAGTAETDVEFKAEGKISGDWYMTDAGIIGVQSAGDGFILSEKSAADFTYAATFKLEGAAAALVFRAERGEDGYLSKYLVANYDNNGKIVKLWSQSREYGNVNVGAQNTDKILLKVAAYGDNVKVYINGNEVINATLDDGEPTEGLLGLNSCAATTTFASVVLVKSEYDYAGSGQLRISGETEQHINSVYNKTLGNVKINDGFYAENGRHIIFDEDYFKTLPKAGVYTIVVKGVTSAYEITVNVTAIPQFTGADVYIDEGCNAVINIGAAAAGTVTLNGTELADGDYKAENGILTVYARSLKAGEHVLVVAGKTVNVTVTAASTVQAKGEGNGNLALIVSLSVVGGVLVLCAATAVTGVILKRKGKISAEK